MENSKIILNAIPVDKKLVHKSNGENVLICNLRRSLPFQLESDLLDLKILPFCSGSEKFLLRESYKKPQKKISGENYTLNGMDALFPADEIKNILKSGGLSKEDFRFFRDFYRKNKKTSCYTMYKIPDENEFLRLERIFYGRKPGLTDKKKAELSEILDRLHSIDNKKLFYANMIVDVNHPYFFEHPNEHVPGMMIIEAVRQLLVACTHKYGNVPLKDYNFVLSSLTVVFKNYLELNYPILFKIVLTNLYTYDSGIWSDVEFRIHVYQAEQEAAIMTFQGNILTSRVFKRLRAKKEIGKVRQWFILKKHIEYKSVIRGHGLKKLETQVEYIAQDECIFFAEEDYSDFGVEVEKTIEFFMYFSSIGFVHGTAVILNINNFGNFSQIHIKYQEMDSADKNNLHEVIKKYGYLLENYK